VSIRFRRGGIHRVSQAASLTNACLVLATGRTVPLGYLPSPRRLVGAVPRPSTAVLEPMGPGTRGGGGSMRPSATTRIPSRPLKPGAVGARQSCLPWFPAGSVACRVARVTPPNLIKNIGPSGGRSMRPREQGSKMMVRPGCCPHGLRSWTAPDAPADAARAVAILAHAPSTGPADRVPCPGHRRGLAHPISG